ncbi:hypothetical protein F0342_02090 [Bacillus sp. CH30_1T]|uniref:sigma factor-like helix-turn-helix DNA-binding protein n=1 Tax=Bacillus sp. CH30_1T TaxID=2604836 RepID=UPI0011EDC288|nr:sigma factor-like helix-turn-helix DNA-binding protein [Bacillus sp. CH30_1T]KAA0566862.1 hypothetical protein F0342_02090 [Bacillus sp. CH30_1T]
MKEDQQNIVQLFYFKGLTQQSIADSTDIPLGTVKGRIRLGLKHLHTCLKGKAGNQFKDMWSKHIGFFVDYVEAAGAEE